MKKYINIRNSFLPVLFQIIILLLWQLTIDKGIVERFILPSPTDVIYALFKILPAIKVHIFVTLKEAVLGFSMAIIIALVLAILMDNIKLIRKSLYPILIVSQTIPTVVLAPLFGMWFGFGLTPKIIVVILVCFFPIVISLMDGLDSVDKDMVNLLKLMGATRVQIFKLVKLPAAMVNFFSGLRIAATYSIMGAVIGEWVGGDAGLGFYLMRVKKSFAIDKVFAVTIVIILLSMLLFGVLYFIERLVTPWNEKENN